MTNEELRFRMYEERLGRPEAFHLASRSAFSSSLKKNLNSLFRVRFLPM